MKISIKKFAIVLLTVMFAPLALANSGQVGGPLAVLGAQDFDHDNNSGTAALTNYAWLQFDDTALSYDPDLDNDSNDYDVECVVGYFAPIFFDISTAKGGAMYETAKSALLAGNDVIIAYTENAASSCVADDLFVVAQ